MSWNWEKPDWPNFAYDSTALEPLEKRFLLQSGEFIGAHAYFAKLLTSRNANHSTIGRTCGPELGWHDARYPVTRAPVSYSMATRWLMRSCNFA